LPFLTEIYTNCSGLPSVSNRKATFGYSPAEVHLGSVLVSTSSATTIDKSIRQHIKLGNSRFACYGRSFGVSSSVGWVDDEFPLDLLATTYTFQREWILANCLLFL
jgi:hypothetical protein